MLKSTVNTLKSLKNHNSLKYTPLCKHKTNTLINSDDTNK